MRIKLCLFVCFLINLGLFIEIIKNKRYCAPALCVPLTGQLHTPIKIQIVLNYQVMNFVLIACKVYSAKYTLTITSSEL